jgi:hypothetical protein
MSSDSQAELNKANGALGLGIASFMCSCFTFIPALIIGLPVMKNAQNPIAKSRAQTGVLLGMGAFAFGVLLSIALFMTASRGSVEYLKGLDQEMRQMDKHIRKSADSPFDVEET